MTKDMNYYYCIYYILIYLKLSINDIKIIN